MEGTGETKPGEHRIYNLGNGSGFSVREIVETAREVTGRGIEATHAPRRAMISDAWEWMRANPRGYRSRVA